MKRKLQDNLKRVRHRIEEACARVGRAPNSVTLVVVTKSASLDIIRQLVELGVADLGESRPQELSRRAAATAEWLGRQARSPAWGATGGLPSDTGVDRYGTSDTGVDRYTPASARAGKLPVAPVPVAPASSPPEAGPRWHQVGHLQRNKVKLVLPWAHLIHSVDTLRLAEEIDAQSARADRITPVMLEVNASGESNKHGVPVAATLHMAELLETLRNIRLCGLMTMAPLTDDEGRIRSTFERLQELLAEARAEGIVGKQFTDLSMGMTNDFEYAVEAGATHVRIGSAIFEGIQQPVSTVQDEHGPTCPGVEAHHHGAT